MVLGLCLSGGGIKGAAHIGVLKAFEENNINFEYISGASSGSIVASLYSMGYCAQEIKDIFKKIIKKLSILNQKKFYNYFVGLFFTKK